MSRPIVIDFALIKYGDGETVETFTNLCGITNVQVNETVETQDRRIRDCDSPNLPGDREVKVIGVDWTLTGAGVTNANIRSVVKSELLAKKVNYEIEYYRNDNTPGGLLLGTDAGNGIMTANNMSIDADADSTWEVTIEGSGAFTYTDAPGS